MIFCQREGCQNCRVVVDDRDREERFGTGRHGNLSVG